MLSQLNDLALKTCGDKTNHSQLLILPFINKYKEKLLLKKFRKLFFFKHKPNYK